MRNIEYLINYSFKKTNKTIIKNIKIKLKTLKNEYLIIFFSSYLEIEIYTRK